MKNVFKYIFLTNLLFVFCFNSLFAWSLSDYKSFFNNITYNNVKAYLSGNTNDLKTYREKLYESLSGKYEDSANYADSQKENIYSNANDDYDLLISTGMTPQAAARYILNQEGLSLPGETTIAKTNNTTFVDTTNQTPLDSRAMQMSRAGDNSADISNQTFFEWQAGKENNYNPTVVEALQNSLAYQNAYTSTEFGKFNRDRPGRFGVDTSEAVKNYQQRVGCEATGAVDLCTVNALRRDTPPEVQQEMNTTAQETLQKALDKYPNLDQADRALYMSQLTGQPLSAEDRNVVLAKYGYIPNQNIVTSSADPRYTVVSPGAQEISNCQGDQNCLNDIAFRDQYGSGPYSSNSTENLISSMENGVKTLTNIPGSSIAGADNFEKAMDELYLRAQNGDRVAADALKQINTQVNNGIFDDPGYPNYSPMLYMDQNKVAGLSNFGTNPSDPSSKFTPDTASIQDKMAAAQTFSLPQVPNVSQNSNSTDVGRYSTPAAQTALSKLLDNGSSVPGNADTLNANTGSGRTVTLEPNPNGQLQSVNGTGNLQPTDLVGSGYAYDTDGNLLSNKDLAIKILNDPKGFEAQVFLGNLPYSGLSQENQDLVARSIKSDGGLQVATPDTLSKFMTSIGYKGDEESGATRAEIEKCNKEGCGGFVTKTETTNVCQKTGKKICDKVQVQTVAILVDGKPLAIKMQIPKGQTPTKQGPVIFQPGQVSVPPKPEIAADKTKANPDKSSTQVPSDDAKLEAVDAVITVKPVDSSN